MKKLFTLALVMTVLSVGGVAAFANDGATGQSAKTAKHVDLDKLLADLEVKKAALLAQNASTDTKDLDAKIEKVKAKIAKKAARKADKKTDKKAEAAAPAAPAETAK